MARKTVRINVPNNIDDIVLTLEKIILRNDGVLPAVPQTTAYIALGNLLGLSVPAVGAGSSGNPATPFPGTKKLPETEIGAPMRTAYPAIKRAYLDLIAIRTLLQTTSNSLQTQLGMAAGQTVTTNGTARNLMNRAIKALLAIYSGDENELETYGLKVTVGTAAAPKTKATAK